MRRSRGSGDLYVESGASYVGGRTAGAGRRLDWPEADLGGAARALRPARTERRRGRKLHATTAVARLEGECTLVLATDMSHIALYLNNGGRPRQGCGPGLQRDLSVGPTGFEAVSA